MDHKKIGKNDGTVPSYSKRIELVLSLDVLGYFKDKRVKNDLFHYTESLEREGVLMRDVKEGYVMKNYAIRKEMLVSPVVDPIEEVKIFDIQQNRIDITTISYF